MYDDWPTVQCFIENGYTVDTPVDPFGSTALHFAVESGSYNMVKWLLERGASPTKEVTVTIPNSVPSDELPSITKRSSPLTLALHKDPKLSELVLSYVK